jgi:hypothetical protein
MVRMLNLRNQHIFSHARLEPGTFSRKPGCAGMASTITTAVRDIQGLLKNRTAPHPLGSAPLERLHPPIRPHHAGRLALSELLQSLDIRLQEAHSDNLPESHFLNSSSETKSTSASNAKS